MSVRRRQRTRAGMASRRAAAAGIAAAMALVLLLVLGGCDTSSAPRPLPDARQILRVELPWEYLYTLDPAGEPTHLGAFPLALLYSGLVALDQHNRPRLADAERVNVSGDALTYTFTLRAGLRFSDGTPITASDIAYSLDRVLSPCTAPRDPTLYQLLVSIKDAAAYSAESCGQNGKPVLAPEQHGPVIETLLGDSLRPLDATTLEITLARPDAAFLVALAHPVASIVERAVIERYGAEWTNHLADNGGQGTSGMYAVKSWQQPVFDIEAGAGERLVLTRQAHVTGTVPRLREVDIAYFWDEGHAVLGYQRGSVDLVLRAEPSDALLFQSQRGLYHTPTPDVFTFALNPTFPPLDDLRVRQALALALDHTRLGLAFVAPTVELLPPTIPGVTPQAVTFAGGASSSLQGDATRARELWLGYVRDRCGGVAHRCAEVPLVERTCGVQPMPASVAQAIGGMWQAALPGLRIRYINYTPNCFFAFLDGCYHVGAMAHTLAADVPDAQAQLAPFAAAQENAPYCVLDPQVRAWLEQAAVTSDPAARAQLEEQAERRVLDSAVVLPIYRPELVWLARPQVADFHAPVWYWFSPDDWAAIHLMQA